MKSKQKSCSSLVERSTKMRVPIKHKGAEIHHTKPQFFTIIVSPSLQLHKLRLPNMFVKDHGKQLSNVVRLRVPNKTYWVVELLKRKGNIWLHTGWNHFAQHYSISSGYLLVFKYYRNSHFRVLIFNTSTLQIDYSPNNLHQKAKQTAKSRAPKIEVTDEDDSDNQQQQQTEGESDERPAKQRNAQNVLRDAKDRVKQRAKAFPSQNRYFKAVIKRRNFKGNSGPFMPVSHSRTYFNNKDRRMNIVLRVKEKTWTINCRREKFGSLSVSLSTGWHDFVLKNALQEGDSCVFELLDAATMTYDVHVLRVSENKTPPEVTDEKIDDDCPSETPGKRGKTEKVATTRCKTAFVVEADKERLEKKAKAFVNGSPGFIITIRKTYIVSYRPVHVPHCHSKEYLKEDGDGENAIVVHGKDQGSWKIEYREENSGPSLTNPSWRKFRLDNNLEIGDVCAFKMVSEVQKAYRVAIFRINAAPVRDG